MSPSPDSRPLVNAPSIRQTPRSQIANLDRARTEMSNTVGRRTVSYSKRKLHAGRTIGILLPYVRKYRSVRGLGQDVGGALLVTVVDRSSVLREQGEQQYVRVLCEVIDQARDTRRVHRLERIE